MDHLDTINTLCDAATVNEVVHRILEHKQCDGWLDKARATLADGCPQTAHLVWEQLRRSRHLSLAEVFRMEWCLAVQCTLHADFRECAESGQRCLSRTNFERDVYGIGHFTEDEIYQLKYPELFLTYYYSYDDFG